MSVDDGYLNKFPEDAAEIVDLIRRADLSTATKLLQVWGSTQRDIGSISAIERVKKMLVPDA